MSHRHVDPFDPQESYGMPSRPCSVCRAECCIDCATPRDGGLVCLHCEADEQEERELQGRKVE